MANLSIEKPVDDPDSKVTGHIRIRAKSQVRVEHKPAAHLHMVMRNFLIRIPYFAPFTQGMALSLGDKISSSQKQSVQAA